MPRHQAVYGKRSRAAINPVDIFGSPQNLREKTVETFKIVEPPDENDWTAETTITSANLHVSSRKALGERNGNAVLKPEIPGAGKQKKKRFARGKKEVKRESHIQDQTKLEREEEPKLSDVVVEAAVPCLSQPEIGGISAMPPVLPSPIARSPHLDEEDLDGQGKEPGSSTEEPQVVLQVPCPNQIQQSDNNTATAELAARPRQPQQSDDPYTSHTSSLLSLTAHEICSFSDWASELAEHFLLSKIAEASFGEVYRLSIRPSLLATNPASTQLLRTEESVLKIIALTPPPATLPTGKRDRERALKKAAAMSKPSDVASEVKLLQRLSSIPGFTNFRDVRVVRGRPGGDFLSAWKDFNSAQREAKKDVSIFPDPAKKNSYAEDQLWAVLEMQDAGTDLERLVEKGECCSIWQVWDVFWQVVLALAKGEEAAEFEHRDLHLGNICVRGASSFSSEPLDQTKKLNFTPLEATLIDYTISRAAMPSSSPAEIAFIDLAQEPHLFAGDSTQEYQYDIYRYMRSAVYFSSPLQPFPDEEAEGQPHSDDKAWAHFHPLTNLVWLHYVLYTLLESLSWPSSVRKAPRGARERGEWRRANELEGVLLAVQEMLDPGVVGQNGVGKAGDLVAVALGEGWLDEGDIVGEGTGAGEDVGGDGELVEKLEELAIAQRAEADVQEKQVGVESETVAKGAKKTRRKR